MYRGISIKNYKRIDHYQYHELKTQSILLKNKLDKLIIRSQSSDLEIKDNIFEMAKLYVFTKIALNKVQYEQLRLDLELEEIDLQNQISTNDFILEIDTLKRGFPFLDLDNEYLEKVEVKDRLNFLAMIYLLCNEYKFKKCFISDAEILNGILDDYEDLIQLPNSKFKKQLESLKNIVTFDYSEKLLYLSEAQIQDFLILFRELAIFIHFELSESAILQVFENNYNFDISYCFEPNNEIISQYIELVKFECFNIFFRDKLIYITPNNAYHNLDKLTEIDGIIQFKYTKDIFLDASWDDLRELLVFIEECVFNQKNDFTIPYDDNKYLLLSKIEFENWKIEKGENTIEFKRNS
jgi:hypothetical protein